MLNADKLMVKFQAKAQFVIVQRRATSSPYRAIVSVSAERHLITSGPFIDGDYIIFGVDCE